MFNTDDPSVWGLGGIVAGMTQPPRRQEQEEDDDDVAVQSSEPELARPPMYKVVLHNDDFTPMEYGVQVLLQTVPSLTQPQAVDIMMEAHNSGVALVITCALEHAEFYCETLQNSGLSSTIEPDE